MYGHGSGTLSCLFAGLCLSLSHLSAIDVGMHCDNLLLGACFVGRGVPIRPLEISGSNTSLVVPLTCSSWSVSSSGSWFLYVPFSGDPSWFASPSFSVVHYEGLGNVHIPEASRHLLFLPVGMLHVS